jgi:hypothetical protein
VLISAPEWRDRARGEVDPALFEVPAHRELFEALRRMPAGGPHDQLPEGLSDAAQAVWTELRESVAALGTAEFDDVYTGAHQTLQARPSYRQIRALTDPGEKRRQLDELDRRYPAFRRARGYLRGAPSARRGPPKR